LPDSDDGCGTIGNGVPDHPAARLVMAYAARDRERRAARPISLVRTDRRALGEQAIGRGLRLGGVPEAYRDGDWAQVRPPGAREVADSLPQRLTGFARGRGALFLGGPGTGKSTAAALVCREVVRLGRSVAWAYVPVLMDEMLESRRRLEIVRRYTTAGLVVFDDFGVRALADWEVGFLDEIVEVRYHARRPMVVTANLTVADLTADPRLVRMVDRWRQRTAATVVAFAGVSRR
jgi:hypothetical protein